MSEQKKTKRRGRPPLPKGQAKAKYVPMRLKEEDFKAFTKAAKANKQTLSEWMRSTLRKATQICPS
jgi:uncharacterized protein (DUF1778 family)